MKPLENPIHFILHDSEGATTANVPTELRRHGYVEVQRTAQMQELANVPVTKRSINIDDNTRMEVSTYKNIYKVDIFLSKPFVEEEEDEDAIDSEVIEDGTKALFRVYSDKILVYDQGTWSVVDSWTEEDTGTTITLGAAYQPAIIPNESKGKAFVGKGKTVTSGLWGQSFFSPRFIDAGPGGVGQKMTPNETPPNDGRVVGESPVTNNAMLQNSGFWLDGKAFPIVDGQTKSFPGGYDDVFAGNLIWDENQQIGWFFIAKQFGQTSWEINILQGGIPYLQDINFTGPTHFEIWKLACYGDGREKLEDDEKDWTLVDTVYLFTDEANEGLFNESTYWANKEFPISPGLRANTPILWGNFFPDGSFECPVVLVVDANQNTFTPQSSHLQDNDYFSSAGSILQGYVGAPDDFVGSVLISKRLRIGNVLSGTSFLEQAELKSISPLYQGVLEERWGQTYSDHANGKGCLVKGLVLGNWYYEYRISTKPYPEAPTTRYYQRVPETEFEIEYWLQLWKTYYPPPTEADLKTFEPQFVEQYLLGTGVDGHTIQRQFLFVHPFLPKLVAFDECEVRWTYKPPPQDTTKIYLGATYKTNHFGEVVDETYAYDGLPNFSYGHLVNNNLVRGSDIPAHTSNFSFGYPFGSETFARYCGINWALNRGPWGEWGRMNFSTFWAGTWEGRGWAAVHSEYGIPEALLEKLDGVPPYIICMRRLIHLPRDHQVFSECGFYGFESRPAVLLKTQIDGNIDSNPDNPVCGPGYIYSEQYAYSVFSTYTEPLRVVEGVEPGLFAGSLDPESPDLKYPLNEETYRWTYRFYSNCLTERELQELTFDEETIDLIDKGETGLDQIPIYLGIL